METNKEKKETPKKNLEMVNVILSKRQFKSRRLKTSENQQNVYILLNLPKWYETYLKN